MGGCSTLCRVNKENIIIKSKVNKDSLNNELDVDNNVNQNQNESEIKIIYEINKKNIWYERIKIFGEEFVENNKKKCKMIIDDKEYEISEKYNITNYNNGILEIKLKGITNMSGMFSNISSLSSLIDISISNTNNITNMSEMFYGCSSLLSLPDISKWNTNNVKDMSYMFYGCSSLLSLPDISKWNTNNVTDMNSMFYAHHYHLYLIFQNGILLMLLI